MDEVRFEGWRYWAFDVPNVLVGCWSEGRILPLPHRLKEPYEIAGRVPAWTLDACVAEAGGTHGVVALGGIALAAAVIWLVLKLLPTPRRSRP